MKKNILCTLCCAAIGLLGLCAPIQAAMAGDTAASCQPTTVSPLSFLCCAANIDIKGISVTITGWFEASSCSNAKNTMENIMAENGNSSYDSDLTVNAVSSCTSSSPVIAPNLAGLTTECTYTS